MLLFFLVETLLIASSEQPYERSNRIFAMKSNSLPRPTHRRDFKIAIICSQSLSVSAVEALFDARWNDVDYGKAPGDPNVYTTGRVGHHNVVVTQMPGTGKCIAASVSSSFRTSYSNIQLALVVGLCGGVPFVKEEEKEEEIVLGDVVISEAVVQYDLGRRFPDRFIRKDSIRDNLGRPSAEIRSFLVKLKTRRSQKRLLNSMSQYLAALHDKPGMAYPGMDKAKLFDSSYPHKHQDLPTCDLCTDCRQRRYPVYHGALRSPCEKLNCDESMLLLRSRNIAVSEDQEPPNPVVHFGLFASGDTVVQSSQDRDQIASREGVIAFETEGAGVWDNFPCVLIKGVCNYADSHGSKEWHNYASATAVACTKAFLEQWVVPDEDISGAGQSK